MTQLAINGGQKTKTTPFGTGKRFGQEEKDQLMEVIDSDMLFYYLGNKVYEFQDAFAEMHNMKHCVACSSGTAAVHIALGTLQLKPGSEVITSSITDMGSITGILYQNLIPVFADIEADTFNMDPKSVEERISKKTGAILVVHHSGLVADMDAFLALGKKYDIPVVEDVAQAYLGEYKGKLAGTMTPISTFSLNHFKHITCGSGGMVLTNDDNKRKLASLFSDKCYDRETGIKNPYFLAPNYQMTELQGAVSLAQVKKLPWIIQQRRKLGDKLTEHLKTIDGIIPQTIPEGTKHTYFLFVFRVDTEKMAVTLDEFSAALEAEGIPNYPRVITGGMPEYAYEIFKNRSAFPNSKHPFVNSEFGTNVSYDNVNCPVAEKAFTQSVNLDMNEFFTEQDIEDMGQAIEKVAGYYMEKR
ncbi:MAG: DegT/DnrJ/EryC1/StrS family aminotransferase [Bacteroidota bacterium]|nr:DegT/DnrJ/EryC1/StrS family aminotransferase [Bacteroidota bacterium]